MGIVTLIENLSFDCFCMQRKPMAKYDDADDTEECDKLSKQERTRKSQEVKLNFALYRDAEAVASRYNMSILPVPTDLYIDNLYPPTNHVDQWNVFIIGNDKTYVHASVYDLDLPEAKSFCNQRPGNVLCRELQDFFEPIYDQTLVNNKLQFFMTWQGKLYLVNTYPIINQFEEVIGAIIFIRDNSLMPRYTLTSDKTRSLVSLSFSTERMSSTIAHAKKISDPKANDNHDHGVPPETRNTSKGYSDRMPHSNDFLSNLCGIATDLGK
jgi:hypothetical protein